MMNKPANDNERMIEILRRMQANGQITSYFAHNADYELKECFHLAKFGPIAPQSGEGEVE